MARDDRQRRRNGGLRATSGYRRRTHWRRWHHGADEGAQWAALDATLIERLRRPLLERGRTP